MWEHETQLLRRSSSELCESNFNIYGRNRVSDQMAASYTEIAFQSHFTNTANHNGDEDNVASHDFVSSHGNSSLSDEDNKLNQDVDYVYQKNDQIDNKKSQKRPASLLCDKSFPYDLDGSVRREGEITHFVAENLEYKIKLSSPITKRDVNQQSASSKNSTPSTSTGLLPRHFVQSHLATIDSNVLSDIEIDAQYLAASVDSLSENLYNLLHSVSSITADNVEIHKNSVHKLTDNMDGNIKCMYTIMAKTEEISKSMKPTEQLALRIREIKRLVDMLENNL